jgi:hypothetical protein
MQEFASSLPPLSLADDRQQLAPGARKRCGDRIGVKVVEARQLLGRAGAVAAERRNGGALKAIWRGVAGERGAGGGRA